MAATTPNSHLKHAQADDQLFDHLSDGHALVRQRKEPVQDPFPPCCPRSLIGYLDCAEPVECPQFVLGIIAGRPNRVTGPKILALGAIFLLASSDKVPAAGQGLDLTHPNDIVSSALFVIPPCQPSPPAPRLPGRALSSKPNYPAPRSRPAVWGITDVVVWPDDTFWKRNVAGHQQQRQRPTCL